MKIKRKHLGTVHPFASLWITGAEIALESKFEEQLFVRRFVEFITGKSKLSDHISNSKMKVIEVFSIHSPKGPGLIFIENYLNQRWEAGSPEWYACQIWNAAKTLERLLDDDPADLDGVAFAAMSLASLETEARLSRHLSAAALAGQKVQKGGLKGAANAHANKHVDHRRYAVAFEKARAKGLKTMEAYKSVSKEFGVSVKTIQRAQKNIAS